MESLSWPEADLEALEHCPMCGGSRRTLLHMSVPDFVFRVAPGLWSIWRCEDCRGLYLDPRPDEATIGAAYAQSYYTHAAVPAAPVAGRLRDLWHSLMNGYLARRYGVVVSPARKVGAWIIPAFPGRRVALDMAVRHLRLPAAGARLLDVGAGGGEFVARAIAFGWAAEGIDPDLDAAAAARLRGLPISPIGVSELDADGRYAAITLSHVLEHTHDIDDALRRCHRSLVPGGRIWLVTPNPESHAHRILGERWPALDPPRHLALPTRRTLQALLAEAGFVEIRSLPSARVTRWTVRWSIDLSANAEAKPGPLRRWALRSLARCAELVQIVKRGSRDETVLTAVRPAQ